MEQPIDGIDVNTIKKIHSKISKITAQYIRDHESLPKTAELNNIEFILFSYYNKV